MQPANCLNCGEALTSGQNYCPVCGQKSDTPRITISYLFHEFMQAVANADKGLLHLLKGLARNPGRVALDYVEGRRKRYFNPFAFLALCIAISLFLFNFVKPYQDLPQPDLGDLEKMPTEHLRELALLAKERAISMQLFYNKYMNLLTVLVAPYFAFILWLFFRHRRRNIPEITLAYVLFAGFGNLMFTVIICPLMAIFRGPFAFNLLVWLSISLQTLYHAWGLKVFFEYRTAGAYFKVLLVLFLAGFIGFIFILIFILFYVYSGSFELLYYLSPPENK